MVRLWRDSTLWAYLFLTLLGLVSLAHRLAPLPQPVPQAVPQPGAGCRVGYVIDGDTVDLRCAEGPLRARILGVDAPELHDPKCEAEQRGAEAARQALRRMIAAARTVTITRHGTDRYGRALIRLSLDGQDAAAALIAAGHGRAYDGGARGGWCGQ